jgi:hypothetical protein
VVIVAVFVVDEVRFHLIFVGFFIFIYLGGDRGGRGKIFE